MAGIVHLPFYATGFRNDDLASALAQLAPIATRYGASRYEVFRSLDDRYKFLMSIDFDRKHDWDAFWFGPEFIEMRAACNGWYQVPLLYVWQELVCRGEVEQPAAVAGEQLV